MGGNDDEAWTDAAAMAVLVDRMLEDGSMEAWKWTRASWVDHIVEEHGADGELFVHEVAVRELLLRGRDVLRGFDLRVTGAWPDIRFVVWDQDSKRTARRVSIDGEESWPRLLRAPSSPAEVDDGEREDHAHAQGRP